ncbi:MAG: UDP-N-acetylmuramate dehydrogenase [Eubacteriaceae bacterium]|jgi:UDP-N-acetylmuramate dehydrogenase|nr:UDP-N-acetylmuramate dehydrogenase [Eubacteriaceae bacterium]
MEELKRLLGADYSENEPMALHTSFKSGGAADYYLKPGTPEALADTLRILKGRGVPYVVLGNMTNVIVRDGGIRGAVVSTSQMSRVAQTGPTALLAEAGAPLAKIANYACSKSLAGLEFAHGIPGTVGGAAVMNAGAYGGEMSQVVCEADVLTDEFTAETIHSSGMEYGYRKSVFLESRATVLSVRFSLAEGGASQIRETMDALWQRRKDKQPVAQPSAGSVFKRPQGHFAGTMIEEAGLKGFRIGGAKVSEKHAGFIVNAGGATSSDFLGLVSYIQMKIMAATGIGLELEVQVIGID